MHAALQLATPRNPLHRCYSSSCLSPLPRFGFGLSRQTRSCLPNAAAVKRSSDGNEVSNAGSWLQKRTRLVEYLKEQQAQWLYRYFRDWRKDAFRYISVRVQADNVWNTCASSGTACVLSQRSCIMQGAVSA
jgi:hypothetical protein